MVLEEAGTEEAEIQIKAEALTPDELEEFNGRMAAKALYLSKARTFLALAAPPSLASFPSLARSSRLLPSSSLLSRLPPLPSLLFPPPSLHPSILVTPSFLSPA